jgi:predicted RNase H-like HicB family nuclease
MKGKKEFVARYERDENNYWSVTAKVGPKSMAVSDGQTLEKARRRIRQAISLLLDAPEGSFAVTDDVVLPDQVRRALRAFTASEAEAKAKALAVETFRRMAAEALTDHGLSRSDAGELLGVSKQRVQQVLGGGTSRKVFGSRLSRARTPKRSRARSASVGR